ncbi:MAG: hypothetical protein Q9181_003966 [Wetmoreana brouardii]
MAAPKKCFQALRTTILCILLFAALIPLAVYSTVAYLLTLPYALFHFSSNSGIRRKDMPAVQKYLDLFQSRHARVAEHLAQVFDSPQWRSQRCLHKVRFWPNKSDTEHACIPFMAAASVTDYTFSLAAGLFFMLEELGFPRRVLWEFLMTEVESNFSVSGAERADYRRVMGKMCKGYTTTLMAPCRQWSKSDDKEKRNQGFSLPEAVPMGCQIVPLKAGDSMDWVLLERGLIVPMDWDAYNMAGGLRRFGLWGIVKKDLDLEEAGLTGYWQLVDCRCV